MADPERNGSPSNGEVGGGIWERLWPRVNGILSRRKGPDASCLQGRRVPRTPSCDPDCEAVALNELDVGDRGSVSCLDDPAGLDARKLAAMGILPGTGIELLQRSPVFVLRIGYSDFAMDARLAEQIRVRRLEDADLEAERDRPSRPRHTRPRSVEGGRPVR